MAANRRASGTLWVHHASRALSSHVEWALADVLPLTVDLPWQPQPAAANAVRLHVGWRGPAGTAARIASALRVFDVRFEVVETASNEAVGERLSYVPSLGLFRATIGPLGDVLVGEDRLRSALASAYGDGARGMVEEVDRLLGGPWDRELEPFRAAALGEPVRWFGTAV